MFVYLSVCSVADIYVGVSVSVSVSIDLPVLCYVMLCCAVCLVKPCLLFSFLTCVLYFLPISLVVQLSAPLSVRRLADTQHRRASKECELQPAGQCCHVHGATRLHSVLMAGWGYSNTARNAREWCDGH